jgi:hypothetical protein
MFKKKSYIECCANCETTNCRLLECGRCALVKYCSKECQKQDWKSNHKLFCKSISRSRRYFTKHLNEIVKVFPDQEGLLQSNLMI